MGVLDEAPQGAGPNTVGGPGVSDSGPSSFDQSGAPESSLFDGPAPPDVSGREPGGGSSGSGSSSGDVKALQALIAKLQGEVSSLSSRFSTDTTQGRIGELSKLTEDVAGQFLNRDAEGNIRGVEQDFLTRLQQSQFTDPVTQRATQLGQTSDFLSRFGRGEVSDLRFEAIRRRTLGSQSEALNRRGIGGSSAALNQLARTEEGLNLQELTAQNQALLQSGQFAQQQAGLLGSVQNAILSGVSSRNTAERDRLASITAGVETQSLPIQLMISALAAEKAGQA